MRRVNLDQLLEVITLCILLGFPLIYFGLAFYDVLYKSLTNTARIERIISLSK